MKRLIMAVLLVLFCVSFSFAECRLGGRSYDTVVNDVTYKLVFNCDAVFSGGDRGQVKITDIDGKILYETTYLYAVPFCYINDWIFLLDLNTLELINKTGFIFTEEK